MSILFVRSNFLLLFILIGAGYGQGVGNVNVFNSEVRGQARGATTVELFDTITQGFAGRSSVDHDGNFVIRDVAPGTYTVRIVPEPGRGTMRPEEVQVSVGDIKKQVEDNGPASTVSAASLAAPPSKQAKKFLGKAQRYAEAGNSAKAIEVLKSAPLDPAGAPYIHSRLGTEYLKSGQFALAAPELEEAVRLLPREPAHHSNLAYAYQTLGRLDDAESEARKALELDRGNAKAHFLLGSVLLDRPSGLKEAMENLKQARHDVPSALFLLAQAYMLTGQKEAAQREIDAFLQVATEAQRAAAQSWLARHGAR